MQDNALARMLTAMDELYPLSDDARRAERAEQTCGVMKRWLSESSDEIAAAALRHLHNDVLPKVLRAMFTNEVIRAIGALARQQHVCREQAGHVVFVTGMEATREYIVEQV